MTPPPGPRAYAAGGEFYSIIGGAPGVDVVEVSLYGRSTEHQALAIAGFVRPWITWSATAYFDRRPAWLARGWQDIGAVVAMCVVEGVGIG